MIKPGRYKHYKGNMYEVIGIAKYSETLEEMVVYRALYGDGGLWVRPASMWEETVTVNGVQMPRFELVQFPVRGSDKSRFTLEMPILQ